MSNRTSRKRALAVASAAGIAASLLAGFTPAGAQTSQSSREVAGTHRHLNNSGSTGHTSITMNPTGTEVTINIRSSGHSPNLPHAQHIHSDLAQNNTCPTPAAARTIFEEEPGRVFLSTPDGNPFYGGIVVSLTTSGDVSPDSALAVDRMPVADANGNVNYSRRFRIGDRMELGQIPRAIVDALRGSAVVQHGRSEFFANPNAYDGEPRSPLNNALPFEATAPVNCANLVEIVRTAGADRYMTAAEVARTNFTAGAVSDIVLVSGENFPDGLAAASLAGVLDAPILLTASNRLPEATRDAILDLAATGARIHIVGGTAAVGANVRTELNTMGFTTANNRLMSISGANRYATAAAVSAELRRRGVTIGEINEMRTVIVATGENFPDALAAGALAAEGPHPILLTPSNTLSAETRSELRALATMDTNPIEQVIVLGGTAAVSNQVFNQIQAVSADLTVIRVAGETRQETAARLARLAVNLAGFDDDAVVMVSGSNFADALTAGPVAGMENRNDPILLSGGNGATDIFLSQGDVQTIRVLGGTAAVSEAEVRAAVTATGNVSRLPRQAPTPSS